MRGRLRNFWEIAANASMWIASALVSISAIGEIIR